MNSNTSIVGIDLGTTYSSIAYVDDSGHIEVISNADGDLSTPSVIFIDGDTVLVGKEAAKASLLDPSKSAECFKRDMGRPHYEKKVCGRFMRPEVLSSMILRKLKSDAEVKIGPIDNVVITVPAYFDDTRRKATQDAGKIAGLKVMAVLNEPIAAAIHYGFSIPGGSQVNRDRIVLVYDLGGGTFDATLMKVAGDGELVTIATDGDIMLGGKDWDKRLLDYVAGEFMRSTGSDPRTDELSFQELAIRIEEAKRTLSKRSSVSIPIAHAGQRLGITVDREKFQHLTADLLNRTQTTVELLVAEAQLTWNDVDSVLLVGGSSRMPEVREMVKRITGKEPDLCLDPDLAVAKGAAIYAASIKLRLDKSDGLQTPASMRLKRLKHRNVNSHSLGVEAFNETTGGTENAIIIPRNTPVPCEKAEVFCTTEPTNARIGRLTINILEGEASDPQACAQIGKCVIDGLPPGLPEGSPVEVVFSYSEEGRIHVSATAREANRSASAEILRSNAMKPEDLEAEQNYVSRLKIV